MVSLSDSGIENNVSSRLNRPKGTKNSSKQECLSSTTCQSQLANYIIFLTKDAALRPRRSQWDPGGAQAPGDLVLLAISSALVRHLYKPGLCSLTHVSWVLLHTGGS